MQHQLDTLEPVRPDQSDETVALRDLINKRTGLFFSDFRLANLSKTLASLATQRGCKYPTDYCRLLSSPPSLSADAWSDVIERLSKPYTSFFRPVLPTQMLVKTLMPRLLAGRSSAPVKIWSAACSTGQEPLTIAIALSEAGWFDRSEITIHASDASRVAIDHAREALYPEPKMRYLEPTLRSRYFTEVTDGWQVRPELHKRITWSVTNLLDEHEIAGFAGSDIIFCCNVFIYFSESAIIKTLRLFERNMPPGGCLVTDSGDHFTSLINGTGLFEEQSSNAGIFWLKR